MRDRNEEGKEMRRKNESLETQGRQRTAELEAANQELESFAYSVSHDLRAPLRAIDGYALMLQEDHAKRLDAEGNRVLGIIRQEAQRLSQLLDSLLGFSRLTRQPLERVEIDMAAMARAVFDELARLEDGRALSLQLDPMPPAHGDETMIRQVWANLLGNAIKFTRTRPAPRISAGCRTEDGTACAYFVADNGVGFDMQHGGRLFGAFQRMHREDEFEGTGVGLALVQRIVHRHGGRVWARAEPEKGATFSFTLPAAQG
jgi:light-regulated signal transduction histidine kinase (bacteriophytochrome)